MKVKVIKPFTDKLDHKTAYTVGTELDWNDEARITDCVNRGLIKILPEVGVEAPKPKKATKKAKQA